VTRDRGVAAVAWALILGSSWQVAEVCISDGAMIGRAGDTGKGNAAVRTPGGVEFDRGGTRLDEQDAGHRAPGRDPVTAPSGNRPEPVPHRSARFVPGLSGPGVWLRHGGTGRYW